MNKFPFQNQFNGIYRGQTVLITGHTGFKGSWLSYWLSQLKANVIGYSRDYPSFPNHYELLNFGDSIISYQADTTDIKSLKKVLKKHDPVLIFHLAAQSLVPQSYRSPLETFATNIMGTANVLESCKDLESVQAVINITSDKCYQNDDLAFPFKEEDRLGGNDPYSCSKAASELLTQCYRKSYYNFAHKLIASTRAGNVIGGGDWAQDRLIPDLVRAKTREEEVKIRNPLSTRPWQHVLEPLSGYLLLGQKLLEGRSTFADAWNFGPDSIEVMSVSKVVDLFQSAWPKLHVELNKKPGFHEDQFLSLDSQKAKNNLGWSPVWSGSTAIKKAVEWYKDFYENGEIITYRHLVEYSMEAARLGSAWASIESKISVL